MILSFTLSSKLMTNHFLTATFESDLEYPTKGDEGSKPEPEEPTEDSSTALLAEAQ